ncbi:hypothetical protein NHX12_022330, partial [Muraenolepis orangiensis]
MQEHNVGKPPQLLRESYLAEARAQQRHSDMSRSDFSNSRHLVYGALKGKAEDPAYRLDPQGPDLSAFLSEEELDKSVNLACQAIGHESREEKVVKVVEKAPGGAAPPATASLDVATATFSILPSAPSSSSFSIPPSAPSSSSSIAVPPLATPSVPPAAPSVPPPAAPSVLPPAAPSVLPLVAPSVLPLVAPSVPTPPPIVSAPQPAPQMAPVRKEPAQPVHMAFRADTKLESAPAQTANSMSHSKAPGETPSNDPDRLARGPPYGLENQSKKEFLNKAADFIEELSSLFKANSSKRVRPRSGKTHKSRTQNKSQHDGLMYAQDPNNRERPILAPQMEEADAGESRPAVSYQPELELEAEDRLLPEQDCLAAEEQPQQCDPPSQQVQEEVEGEEEEAGKLAPTDTPYSEDPVCEPPCFIQKLKSREVLEGSKVQLDCAVRGLPVPEVRWFCEGKELENSPDIQIVIDGERHSLTIAEAFEEDTGRYSCFASNFYGTDSTSAEIYVEGASSTDSDGEPLFEPFLKLLHLILLLHLIKLLKLLHFIQIRLIKLLKLTQLLPLQSFSPPPPQCHSLCMRSQPSPIATDVSMVESSVQVAPTQMTTVEEQEVRPIMAAPVFTKSLQVVMALEGQLVVLECRVKGVPSPRVEWYREGTVIEDSPDFRILQKKPRSPSESEEICTLVIAEVFPEDSGMFTCTASNKYGTESSIGTLQVKGNSRGSSNVNTLSSAVVESGQVQNSFLSEVAAPAVKHQPEVTVTTSVKPHSSSIRLDPLSSSSLRLDPLSSSTLRLDPHSSSVLRPNPLSASLPSLDPQAFGGSSREMFSYTSTPGLDPQYLSSHRLDQSGSSVIALEPHSFDNGTPFYLKPFSCASAVATEPQTSSLKAEQETTKHRPTLPDLATSEAPKVRVTPTVVPLPDPPATSCLKTSALTNHREPRSSAKAGLHVHFRLPEDEEEEQCETSGWPYEDTSLAANRGPPPVLTKPKLDPAQLRLLHNQVLLEQQQDAYDGSVRETPAVGPAAEHDSDFHAIPTDTSQSALSSLHEITSPAPMLRSTHASLMNLAATSQSFNYARPKEFLAAQPLSPIRSPSPTESPVPLLNELAAELNSSAASSPTIPPFSPPLRMFPTRVLQSPTSPSSTPSPIQNPVAFLSSVLPSLALAQATNSMGLPKSAPVGQLKRLPKSRVPSSEDIRVSKEVILNDLERRLRFNDDSSHVGFQQKLNNEGKTASRLLGPNIPATVFSYDEAYKVSNFEQRLMSEIEFRLERTPVEESDDEVHHDEVPTGRCIAPIFDKKLKNFRAMEGVPVTFTCKLVGIPIPKVYWFKDGKQILRKNDHYKKIREADGTFALHIDCTTNDDDGNYTVMAANPQGRISCSGHLIVQTGASRNRMTPINSQRVRARIQEVEEGEPTQERFFQPHFLQAPGDMVAHEGRLCRLDCKVSGLPNPELMWLVNGKPIYPDIFHRMLVRENGVHSLIIDPVVQNHAGSYTCIASNKAGQSSFCLDLKVL